MGPKGSTGDWLTPKIYLHIYCTSAEDRSQCTASRHHNLTVGNLCQYAPGPDRRDGSHPPGAGRGVPRAAASDGIIGGRNALLAPTIIARGVIAAAAPATNIAGSSPSSAGEEGNDGAEAAAAAAANGPPRLRVQVG